MRRLTAATDTLAALGLAALLVIVAGNVAARAVFDATEGAVNLLLSGAIELSGFALSVTVFAALPGAALRGLARVDILLDRLPDRLRRGIERFWFAILGGVSALLAWLLVDRAATEVAARHLSQDLGWPLWPFTAFAALAATLLAIAALAASLGPSDAQDRAG